MRPGGRTPVALPDCGDVRKLDFGGGKEVAGKSAKVVDRKYQVKGFKE